MRTVFILLLGTLPLLLTSCANESDWNRTVIAVDKTDYKNVLNTSEIIDTSTVDFIRLDSKNGIIGTIDKLIVTDNELIILDKATQKVWIYDFNGEYINAIKAQGRGPNEYLNAHTITYKAPNLIGILDDAQRSLLWFNLLGAFVERNEIPYYASDIYEEAGSLHVMYRYIPENAPTHEKFYYHKKPIGDDSSKYAFPYYPFGLFFTVDDPFFIVNGSDLLVRNPFDNGLYTYQDGVLSIKYEMNFSKPQVPYSNYMHEANSEALSREIQNGNYQGSISQVVFTPTHLSMRYSESQKGGGTEVVNIVYNIANKELKVFSGVTVDEDFEIYYQHPIASDKDRFFSVLHPYTLQDKTIKRLNIVGDTKAINPIIMSFKYSTDNHKP